MSRILLRYFPRSTNLKYMKNITNVDLQSNWDFYKHTGSMILSYTYLGLDVKFLTSITKENDKFIHNYELYAKFNSSDVFSEIDVDTFESENIKSFTVIKEIFRCYNLKTIIQIVT